MRYTNHRQQPRRRRTRQTPQRPPRQALGDGRRRQALKQRRRQNRFSEGAQVQGQSHSITVPYISMPVGNSAASRSRRVALQYRGATGLNGTAEIELFSTKPGKLQILKQAFIKNDHTFTFHHFHISGNPATGSSNWIPGTP